MRIVFAFVVSLSALASIFKGKIVALHKVNMITREF